MFVFLGFSYSKTIVFFPCTVGEKLGNFPVCFCSLLNIAHHRLPSPSAPHLRSPPPSLRSPLPPSPHRRLPPPCLRSPFRSPLRPAAVNSPLPPSPHLRLPPPCLRSPFRSPLRPTGFNVACKYFVVAANEGQPKAFYQPAKILHIGVGFKKNIPLLFWNW
ncbi:hypothetical protein RJT34_23496 [Clitoria ternatea]|uniref:Uncharacterized protein n=1 Tax=Clitoria ternatea TaxID=43366 RepID=A0AAN9IGM1_CLITE